MTLKGLLLFCHFYMRQHLFSACYNFWIIDEICLPARFAPIGLISMLLTVRLDGSVEYETSDGEIRHVSAGSFVLVTDTHGKGHLSRHSPEAQTVIWISLPNGLELPSSK